MATAFNVQSFIIIIVCFHFHSRSSYGFNLQRFELPRDAVETVTYGEPCHSPRYLPVTIEEPVIKPVTESVLPTPCTYQPLKLNYRVSTSTEARSHQPRAEYPVAVQIPEVPKVSTAEIICPPDPLRGKSYTYNIQTLPSPSVPISRTYDLDFQVPSSSPPTSAVPTPHAVKLLTGLISKIDRVIIPACHVPSSSCCETDTS